MLHSCSFLCVRHCIRFFTCYLIFSLTNPMRVVRIFYLYLYRWILRFWGIKELTPTTLSWWKNWHMILELLGIKSVFFAWHTMLFPWGLDFFCTCGPLSSHLPLSHFSSPGSSFPVDSPQKKNYERLQKALDSVMSIREMTQVFCPLLVPCLPTQVPYSLKFIGVEWRFRDVTQTPHRILFSFSSLAFLVLFLWFVSSVTPISHSLCLSQPLPLLLIPSQVVPI